MGGAAKFPNREKSDFDRVGYKLKNASFAAKFTPSPKKPKVTEEEIKEDRELAAIRNLCQRLQTQEQLDSVLLSIDDLSERKDVFYVYLPYLPFEGAMCPLRDDEPDQH